MSTADAFRHVVSLLCGSQPEAADVGARPREHSPSDDELVEASRINSAESDGRAAVQVLLWADADGLHAQFSWAKDRARCMVVAGGAAANLGAVYRIVLMIPLDGLDVVMIAELDAYRPTSAPIRVSLARSIGAGPLRFVSKAAFGGRASLSLPVERLEVVSYAVGSGQRRRLAPALTPE